MRTTLITVAALVLGGCSEQGFNGSKDPLRAPDSGVIPTSGTTTTNVPTGTPVGYPWSWGGGTGSGGTATGGTGTATGGTPQHDGEQVDDVVQPASFDVDVLWVVDNSCSMQDDQNSLTANFPSFVDYFVQAQGIDYHLGVVSTDVVDPNHSGQLREDGALRWIDNTTPNPTTVFNNMALMGTSGSGNEAGRAAVDLATQTHANGWNAGFFRPQATLAVIVISDEDDSSSMFGYDIAPVVANLRAFKSDPAMVSFSAIAGPVPNGCATADPGFDYVDVQTQIGGVFYDICTANWAQVLTNLAAAALSNRREFYLSEIPDVNTLSIEVVDPDGTVSWYALNTDFTYDGARNSVTLLNVIPGPLAHVYIHYNPSAGAAW